MMAAKKNKIKILSPAKINLYLDVLEKRADGYHEIETIFQAVSLYDYVYLERLGESTQQDTKIVLECTDESLPTDQRNLVYRAAETFFLKTGIEGAVRIKLEKNIPVAAGLGGGSSNAAATLKGLVKLFSADLDSCLCNQLACQLGADVPFFFNSPTAIGRGVGEKLRPIDSQLNFFLVLLNPKFAISTAEVYRALSWPLTAHNGDIRMTELALMEGNINLLRDNLYNRLESVVIKVFPKLDELKKMLMGLGAQGVLLSGSGPTIFAIHEKEEEALRIKSQVDKKYGMKIWTSVCRTLHVGGTDGNNTSEGAL